MEITLTINGKSHKVDVEPETPLLWVLRDTIGLTGTKYGCGVAQCGACTVHVDGQAMKSCQSRPRAAFGKQITTIEGLSPNSRIRSSKPGSRSACRSAAIASRARSWRRRRCSISAGTRATPRSKRRWRTISAVAAPTCASSRPFAARRRSCSAEEWPCRTETISRRTFIRTSVAAGGGLLLGFHIPTAFAATTDAEAVEDPAGGRCRGQRLADDRPGRHRHDPRAAHRNGPGRHDLGGAAGRRGAGRRVVEGAGRVRRRQPACAQQQGIQRDVDARLEARAPAAPAYHAGRRFGARTPEGSGGRSLGRRPLRRSRRSRAC